MLCTLTIDLHVKLKGIFYMLFVTVIYGKFSTVSASQIKVPRW